MRQVVGRLREEAPTGPQPVLAQLNRLLGEADELDVRLQVTGDPRLLPPGLELSGYRIVEHLLNTLEKDPAAEATVDVVFGLGRARVQSSGRKRARKHGPTCPRRRDPNGLTFMGGRFAPPRVVDSGRPWC